MMEVKVNIDVTELTNALNECQNDLEIIKEAIIHFNNKYEFVKIDSNFNVGNPLTFKSAVFPLVKIRYELDEK